jgi:hypothetical protein
MEHPSPEPVTSETPANRYSAPTNGIAVASVSLGFFSLVVFWWHPFSSFLAGTGLVLGLVSLLVGIRGGRWGENLALIGTGLCAFSLTIVLTLNQFLRYAQWENLPWNW